MCGQYYRDKTYKILLVKFNNNSKNNNDDEKSLNYYYATYRLYSRIKLTMKALNKQIVIFSLSSLFISSVSPLAIADIYQWRSSRATPWL